jgi:hypothetical protein
LAVVAVEVLLLVAAEELVDLELVLVTQLHQIHLIQ